MLAIVPARGGSRGVPRKNLRALNGTPLLLHTLGTLQQVTAITRIVVSTEDAEIAAVAENHGYEVLDRPVGLAGDAVTLDAVAHHAVCALNWVGPYGVFQPTSPTLTPETIAAAVKEFTDGGYRVLRSVTRDTKLRYDGHGQPLYRTRVNRQYAAPEWAETGGFQLFGNGFTEHIFPVDADEAHDIDTPDDLEAARRVLSRKRIEFRLVASESLGAGHLYRCLTLADELAHHHVQFTAPDGWARNIITGRGYPVGGWANPDLVVFDTLDTTEHETAAAKAGGARVVTLEDLGAGSRFADLTINELYNTGSECGPKWAVLRPEFLGLPPLPTTVDARRVLVLFGGTDPAHLSERVSELAAEVAEVTVLCGPAARPTGFAGGVKVASGSVSRLMRSHDLVVTSAGRTVHEAAACGVPVVSIAANERESRHSHCDGVLRMGLHATVSDEQIVGTIDRLLRAPDLRAEMAGTARAAVDGRGSRRIVWRLEGLLEGL